ncbi:hypothetical protein ACWDE0_12640 [Streptomyces sp. 900105755]
MPRDACASVEAEAAAVGAPDPCPTAAVAPPAAKATETAETTSNLLIRFMFVCFMP